MKRSVISFFGICSLFFSISFFCGGDNNPPDSPSLSSKIAPFDMEKNKNSILNEDESDKPQSSKKAPKKVAPKKK